jgi:hypothetical protein
MTTPPTLRIFRGPQSERADEADETTAQRPMGTPFYAVAFSSAVHLLVLVPATILAVLNANNGPLPLAGVPENLLRVVFIAFILAQCGLAALWFVRCAWPNSAKALAGTLTFVGLWLMLITTMQPVGDLFLALAWGASLGLLAVLVIVTTTLLELTLHDEHARSRARFGLLHLLAATTGIALALGLARNAATRQGFLLGDVFDWQFFRQVLMAGCTSAALAFAIDASLRCLAQWPARALFCTLVLIGITIAAPLAFQNAVGDDTGATLADLRWLFGSEGLFLVGMLVPLQMLREVAHISK